jgi:hypothetical protein
MIGPVGMEAGRQEPALVKEAEIRGNDLIFDQKKEGSSFS